MDAKPQPRPAALPRPSSPRAGPAAGAVVAAALAALTSARVSARSSLPPRAVLGLVRSGFPWAFAVTAWTSPHGGRFRPPHLWRQSSLPASCYTALAFFFHVYLILR